MFEKIRRIVGVTSGMSKPLPSYRVIADGLVVTDSRATAWLSLSTSSNEMASEAALDAELLKVIASARRTLANRDCQLKIVWGKIDAGEYFESADAFTIPEAMGWAQARADSIDSWEQPERHVFLGIEIEDRSDARIIRAINNAVDWGRGDRHSIPVKELRFLDERMRALAGSLAGGVWKARPTPVETLSWLIARDSFRTSGSAPVEGMIHGASLARLSRGRAVPLRDHIRFYDEAGQEVAYTTVLAITQFPEDIDTAPGGNGQWLLALSQIVKPPRYGSAFEESVWPEASVRFRFRSQASAIKTVDKVRQSAKEQRLEASRSATGEPDQTISDSEIEMIELKRDLQRGKVGLVEAWPILTVSEDSLDDLHSSVDAVIEAYAERGITVEVCSDTQAEAWASTLIGDEVRLDAYNHIMDAPAFFGSGFWGGSLVGDEDGPAIGHTTGATPSIVRHHATEAALRGDTTTVAVLGRSGRGKTTLVQLLSLDAGAEGAWVPVLDLKGDLNNSSGGIVAAARNHGIPADRVEMSAEHAGACDLLAVMDPEDALIHAHSQLMLLISDSLRMAAHPVLMEQISTLIESGKPRSSARLIDQLAASGDEVAQRVARELRTFQGSAVGRMIVGEPTGVTLSATPGIHLLQFPKLDLPDAKTSPSDWTVPERVSAAVIRGALAWITNVSRRPALRGMRKLVAVPEAHMLTATREGAAFLSLTARLARALGLTLVIDSQDPASISSHDGIMEQISTAYAFSQSTATQQDAVAKILGVEPSDRMRQEIEQVSVDPLSGDVWHGHCLMRHRGRLAAVQVAVPNNQVLAALDTSPTSERNNHVA
ncbi:MAG: ATP-binding protein [Schaalia hyovaginalis]|uniref:ATP-binding protein n=1 Tax=Schaalia hyovaginalis TaxID=29316 RepID=UPI002A9132EB|nr:ATP-binding protein [Schaalia hyovaginalis]MDY6213504.1 ATP-binding protein [Schaalia hyovaginalis]